MSLRVMCIDEDWKVAPGFVRAPFDPVFGVVYTVSNSRRFRNRDWYELEELGPNNHYEQSGFVPVSDIDETEMLRENILVNN